MAYELLRTAPAADNFIPLSEHQAQTPGSFFGGRPVLHLHSSEAALRVLKADLDQRPDFAALRQGGSSVEGDADADVEIDGVSVWVTSRYLMLWSPAVSLGIQIPYPTITIHAQVGNAVLLELNLSDANTADEDLEFLQLRIVPRSTHTRVEQTEPHANGQSNGEVEPEPVKQLYDAISACQELNPDPNPEDDDEDGGGFDETAPGATGWITSENMAEFMDENGDFRMPEGTTVVGGADEDDANDGDGLGEGAGRRRGADELVDGEGAGDEETKWQRTD